MGGNRRFPPIMRPPRGRRPLCQGERRRGWISPAAMFVPPARSPSVQCPRGDRRAHDARPRRWLCGQVLGGAPRDAPRRARSGRCRGSARRARSRRRRCRLPTGRRARDRLHRRLLSSARRRPANVRCDRGDERAERRLRDGRRAAPRALGDRVSRGASGRGSRRGAGGRRGASPRGGRDPRGRPHDPRRRAEVRACRRRPRASGADLAEGRGTRR